MPRPDGVYSINGLRIRISLCGDLACECEVRLAPGMRRTVLAAQAEIVVGVGVGVEAPAGRLAVGIPVRRAVETAFPGAPLSATAAYKHKLLLRAALDPASGACRLPFCARECCTLTPACMACAARSEESE